MRFNPFSYPKQLYNEGDVLDIYKKKFPFIVKEYKSITKKTYYRPLVYRQIVQKKANLFDKLLKSQIKKYHQMKRTLTNLLSLDVEVHHNYAFNFWLISYAIGDGPLALHYVQMIEKILKKLYSKKEEFIPIRDAFIRTDFEIFYHKILMDSIEIIDLLKQIPVVWKKLSPAKKLSLKSRQAIYNQIIAILKRIKSKNNFADKILKIWRHHLARKNMTPIYNMLNQGLDYYQENLQLKQDLAQVRKTVAATLKYTQTKLSKNESTQLSNLYLLIKEMLKASRTINLINPLRILVRPSKRNINQFVITINQHR